ncbi:site-specific integrase [Myroides marinus]|uniref:site-specific integrase n=1 Tax=Myroides marinus TaxID=703342 RepID=UPI0025773192|nr:site-specific integrase [Myroides marinus]MDM1532845.1 phage integrase SAM-like domain-containing protein [Myroides marinus]MDM1539725.1 phage integrase SAM-like domain-containing protein [Myroides marinus]
MNTTKVALRQKSIKQGRKSLYLDFYPPILHPLTKKPTRREFLGLYIFEKPKTPIDKIHNTETLRIAESIRQKRENIINKPEIYNEQEKKQLQIQELGKLCFVEYFEKLARKRTGNNFKTWLSVHKYLYSFTNGSIKFEELNISFLEELKHYFLNVRSVRDDKTTLSQNTASSYFNKIKAALKQAYKEDILQNDLNSKIEPIKETETRKEYLTLEELNLLVNTPCNNPLLKRAALFSALTGLRFSDIQKMQWSEIEFITEQGYFLNYNQKKTKGVEVLPISEQAYQLTEGLTNPKDMPQESNVFEGLKYSAYHNKHLLSY